MAGFIDLTGQRFERLEVLSFAGFNKHRNATFLCRCDCGNERIVTSSNLRRGKQKSCGCYVIDVHTTHGQLSKNFKGISEYSVWSAMQDRCTNKNIREYHNYGGRGIKVCDRWVGEHGFENFIADMGRRPSMKHSIDRIDNDGNYEPSNCRWATRKEQMRNVRYNRWLEFNGKRMILKDWQEELKIPHTTFWTMLSKDSFENVLHKLNYRG